MPKPSTPPSVKTAASVARTVQRETGGGSFAPYQAIILAEFVAAEILVAVTPVVKNKSKPGMSPYEARDMTKLLALGLVFFLLELGAVGGTGMARFGAWFGGLLLLTVGLGEAASITKILSIFGGSDADQQQLGKAATTGPEGPA